MVNMICIFLVTFAAAPLSEYTIWMARRQRHMPAPTRERYLEGTVHWPPGVLCPMLLLPRIPSATSCSGATTCHAIILLAVASDLPPVRLGGHCRRDVVGIGLADDCSAEILIRRQHALSGAKSCRTYTSGFTCGTLD